MHLPKRLCYFLFLLGSLIFSAAQKTVAQPTITQGSYLIDMGVNSGVMPAGLRPYGMVHELVKFYKVPIIWVVRDNKTKDAVDYTIEGFGYKGGILIVPKEFITGPVQTVINQWRAATSVTTANGYTAGLVTARQLAGSFTFSGALVDTIQVAPSWTLDAANGSLAIPFYTNAGIPASAYNSKTPPNLRACDDIFVMPHADPKWSTHGNLFTWNNSFRGAIWTGCHAGSALSNTYNPANVSEQMNFLTTKVTTAGPGIILPVPGSGNYAQNSLILWGNHGNGSPPYNTNKPIPASQTGTAAPPDDRVSQFIGAPDAATQSGSEQIYLPVKGASWLPSTLIITYDSTQANVPGISPGAAAVIAYGRAFGDVNRGLVMYEAGHNINQNNPGGVAAERAFFNWSFFAARDKAVRLGNIAGIPADGRIYLPLSLSVTATSPVNASPFTFNWSAIRVSNSSAIGSFSPNGNTSAGTTTFSPGTITAPTAILIYVSVTDTCGRTTTTARPATLMPLPAAPFPVNDDEATIETLCYVPGINTTINVAANDSDADGDLNPNSVLLQNPANPSQYDTSYTIAGQGTWTAHGPNVTFTPAFNFFGRADIIYRICDNTPNTGIAPFLGPLCTNATITVHVGTPDVHGCYPGSIYDAVSSVNASAQNNTGVTNAVNAVGAPDYDPAVASTYAVLDNAGDILTLDFGTLRTAPSSDSAVVYFASQSTGTSVTAAISYSTNGSTFTSVGSFATADNEGTEVRFAVPPGGARFVRIQRAAGTVDLLVDAAIMENWACTPAVLTANIDNAVVREDIPQHIRVTENDFNPGNLPLLLTIATPPVNGIVSVNADYSITYLNNTDFPSVGADAVDSFKYRVCNSRGYCTVGLVNVTIKNDSCSAGQYKPLDFGSPQTRTFSGTTNTIDAQIREDNANNNYGGNTTTELGKKTGNRRRFLIAIPDAQYLSQIPANANIQSATLRLTITGGDNSKWKFGAYQVTGSPMWNESQVTWGIRATGNSWTTPGSDFNPGALSVFYLGRNNPPNNGTNGSPVTFDITSAVTQWQDNIATNRGIMIGQAVDSTQVDKRLTLGTSENGTANNQPLFTIIYVQPLPCATIPNRAPLSNPDTATTITGRAVSIRVLANDHDADVSNTISVLAVNRISASKGTVSLIGDTVVYTPNSSVFVPRTDTLLYAISDGSLNDTSYVYVHVEPADPNVNADTSVANSGTVQVINLAANDNDPNNFPLSPVTVIRALKNGTYSLSGDTLTYTPAPGFYGYDTMIYERCQVVAGSCGPGLCDTALVVLKVNNLAPSAKDTLLTTAQCISISFDLAPAISDPEGEQLTITILSYNTSSGTLIFNGGSSYTFTSAPGFSGSVMIPYYVTDPGGLSSAIDTITINVSSSATNQPPIALNDSYNTATGDGVGFSNTDLYIDVLSNDTDPEGNNLVVGVNGVLAPAHGTVSVLQNGTILYHSDYNFVGVDSFRYVVCDVIAAPVSGCAPLVSGCDTATVIVLVQPDPNLINDFPLVIDDNNTTAEDVPVSGSVTGNDAPSLDGGNSYSVVTNPAHGTVSLDTAGNYTYTPASNFNGIDTFIYRLCDGDGDCDTAIVIITITPVDDVPVALNDTSTTNEDTAVSINVCTNDTASGDGGNTTTVATPPLHGTVTLDSSCHFTYTPDPNFNGTDTFRYQLCDVDGDCDTAIVVINVTPVDDVPIVVNDTSVTPEDTAVSINVCTNDTASGDGGNTTTVATPPAHGTVTLDSFCHFTYTPDPNFNGTDTFRYQLCDVDGDCDTALVVINVTPVDDLPIAGGIL